MSRGRGGRVGIGFGLVGDVVGFVARQVVGVAGVAAQSTMKSRQTVEIVGFDETLRMLKTVTPRVANNISRRTVVSIARDVRDDMRDTVRTNSEDTGTLRRAIRHRRERGAPGEAEASVYITHGHGAKNDAYYYHMVEFGTQKTPEKPYIRPTVKVWASRLPQVYHERFGRELEKELAKIAKKTVPGLQ